MNNTKNTSAAAAQTTPATITVADDSTMELSVTDRFAHMDIAADLAAGHGSYCSMTAVDDRAKVTLYNACATPAKIADMINKQIKLMHVYIEIIPVVSEQTGEVVNCPRVVLIDDHGKGYQAVSTGIYNSVKRIISLFGDPAGWDKPHTVEVQNVSLKDGQHTFNLLLVD